MFCHTALWYLFESHIASLGECDVTLRDEGKLGDCDLISILLLNLSSHFDEYDCHTECGNPMHNCIVVTIMTSHFVRK